MTISNTASDKPMRGRFAPSPTGMLHAGSLVTALASWLCVRQAGGRWLIRVDDIDPPREVPGMGDAIIRSLARLGLVPDEPVMRQSTRNAAYQNALDTLRNHGHAFRCWCSRKDLEPAGGLHRDGQCITTPRDDRPPAWRVHVDETIITFDDSLQGYRRYRLRDVTGDFVIRRADGLWAYQLACAVDDAAMGMTDIVRGEDLLDSTPRQIHLQHLLGLETPRYVHLPLITDKQGRKLSKSDADKPLDDYPAGRLLRAALQCLGLDAAQLAGIADHDLLDFATSRFRMTAVPQHAMVWPLD